MFECENERVGTDWINLLDYEFWIDMGKRVALKGNPLKVEYIVGLNAEATKEREVKGSGGSTRSLMARIT